MEAVKDVSSLIYTKARGGRFRWLTISTLMLAIGMLLHLVSPSVAGFTPNWMIATYVVAILLTKPSYRQCLGICMVAALMEVFTSKSAFPYGDFASEFAGAYVAGFFAHSVPPFKIGRFSLRPAIAGFITTLVSGFIFVSILTVVVGIPISVYLYGILPMVALVGVGNAIITPFLYFPALKLFRSMQYMTESDVEDSNHSHLNLQQKGNGVIGVEHLSYSYLFSNAPALENVNINIEQGSFVVITGPNGAGKTTLLMSMAGAIPHYYGGTMKGMVFTGGKAVTQTGIADLASSIGVILSDYSAQIVTMTVGEEMAFTLENHGFSPEEIRRRSEEALRKVHLDGLEERKVSTLSGGQRQRLVVAAVLAEEPKVLVMYAWLHICFVSVTFSPLTVSVLTDHMLMKSPVLRTPPTNCDRLEALIDTSIGLSIPLILSSTVERLVTVTISFFLIVLSVIYPTSCVSCVIQPSGITDAGLSSMAK